MLKVYTNTSLLTEENRSYVFPLLFDLHFTQNKYLSDIYVIVEDANSADIFISPLEYTYALKFYNREVIDIHNKAKSLKKNLWVYSGGDFGFSLKDKTIYNFRLSGFHSKLNERTIIMPSFINDPYKAHLNSSFKTLDKVDSPKIGFVGHANTGAKKYFKELLSYIKSNVKRILFKEKKDYQSFYPSSIKRASYLNALSKSKELKSNFILRKSYRAGVRTAKEKLLTTNEFYNNLYTNPYTFCLRGAGNFSVRFYETLAVGRIPILINTDCRLPLSGVIDWNQHSLIIDESEDDRMVEKIIEFHNQLDDKAFAQLQESNRLLWKNYLNREAFFKVVHDSFKNKLK